MQVLHQNDRRHLRRDVSHRGDDRTDRRVALELGSEHRQRIPARLGKACEREQVRQCLFDREARYRESIRDQGCGGARVGSGGNLEHLGDEIDDRVESVGASVGRALDGDGAQAARLGFGHHCLRQA